MTSVRVDDYVIAVLLPDLVGHDRRPAAFVVYLALWRLTRGGRVKLALSLREIVDATGLSKRAIQESIDLLIRRRLLHSTRISPTSIPVYQLLRSWVRKKPSATAR